MEKQQTVDVYRAGVRVYRGMIDDPSLHYLHWGNGYGFVLRRDIPRPLWELRPVASGVDE